MLPELFTTKKESIRSYGGVKRSNKSTVFEQNIINFIKNNPGSVIMKINQVIAQDNIAAKE